MTVSVRPDIYQKRQIKGVSYLQTPRAVILTTDGSVLRTVQQKTPPHRLNTLTAMDCTADAQKAKR